MGPPALPHPDRIRPGQRFFPRAGRRRQPATVRRVDGESIRVHLADGSERSLALDRLLAIDDDGQGIHYQYLGWRRRSGGYRAELEVISIAVEGNRCLVRLPEWDPRREIEQPLAILPDYLRAFEAIGTCLADLSSQSVAGLNIHDCGRSKIRGASRQALFEHPTDAVEGQRFRNRRDGSEIRLLESAGTEGQKGARDKDEDDRVRAWNGRRVVRISVRRLVEVRANGEGSFYEFLGGGIWAARRLRQAQAQDKL